MKYLQLLKKYLFVFVGAVLFGLAAVKVKSAQRGELKANDKLRKASQADIDNQDEIIDQRKNSIKKAETKSKRVRENAINKLDTIAKNSGSVGSLLDEYDSKRM